MMPQLAHLWLPILLSAGTVWIASAIAWMALPHHKKDFKSLADEQGFMGAVRAMGIKPGLYGFPDFQSCNKKDDATFMAKIKEGPVGLLHVWPPNAMTSMGPKMIAIFCVYIIVSGLVAYIGVHTLLRGTEFAQVFRVTGTAAILGYCFAGLPNAICFNVPMRNLVMNLIDGIAYGLITGAIFAAMWPKA